MAVAPAKPSSYQVRCRCRVALLVRGRCGRTGRAPAAPTRSRTIAQMPIDVAAAAATITSARPTSHRNMRDGPRRSRRSRPRLAPAPRLRPAAQPDPPPRPAPARTCAASRPDRGVAPTCAPVSSERQPARRAAPLRVRLLQPLLQLLQLRPQLVRQPVPEPRECSWTVGSSCRRPSGSTRSSSAMSSALTSRPVVSMPSAVGT